MVWRDLRIGWFETTDGMEGRRHLLSAVRRAHLPMGRHYTGREIPSLFIFACKVERFIPRRAAAPLGPASTQPVS